MNNERLNPLKNFWLTYLATVKIAWQVNKKLLISLTALNALNGALVFPELFITKLLVDTVLQTIITHNVNQGLQIIALVSLLGLITDQLRSFADEMDWINSQTLARQVDIRIAVAAAGKINALSIADAENPQTRNLYQKIVDTGSRSAWGLIMPVSSLPKTIFSLVSALIPVIIYTPLLLLPAVILTVPSILLGKKIAQAEHKLSTKNAPIYRIYSALDDFTSKGRYFYENKILNHVPELLKRRLTITNNIFTEQYNMRLSYRRKRVILGFPTGLFVTIVRLFLYYQAILQKLTLGTAQMTAGAVGQFMDNFTGLIRQGNDIYQNYLFVKDYEYFMTLSEESSSNTTSVAKKLETGIEFQNVWFKYPQNEDWIIKDVSFSIGPHDNVAIVGENGAGKTTLIKLLCRFYLPQKGKIMVNGKDINDYDHQKYRQAITALFQDFAQYPFSAKDNIGFGDISKASDLEAIKKAAKLTGVDDFITSLPEGYDNPLDKEFPKGIEPSKGQWQRIALARTLFKDAPILILDEPTSNVDPQAEEKIFEEVLSLAAQKIIILVSHRFSTVRKANKILVLENGKLIEQGSHEELMKKKSTYADLFNLQAKSYQ